MLVSWFESLEDYQSQIACAKQVFYSAIYQSGVGNTVYLSERTIKLIEEELEQHEQFLSMLVLLKGLGLDHLAASSKKP